MALTNVPLGLAVGKTIEFVGVGPIGQKRLIDSFDYISHGLLQRVNVVAPPSEDWVRYPPAVRRGIPSGRLR
jgi:hypothetical protein